MDQNEVSDRELSDDQANTARDAVVVIPSQHNAVTTPSAGQMPCPTCSGGTASDSSSYVYALGRIDARFPDPSVEKEYAQATGRTGTAGLTDRQALNAVLSMRENRYLVRQLCWMLTIEGLETYLLQPRHTGDFDLLVEALRPTPSPLDVDVVIGTRGGIAPPELCAGLMIPIVIFDQIYSFNRDAVVEAVPRPEKMSAEEFAPVVRELFERNLQLADNAGASDDHRALNYLAMRYPAIYATAAEQYGRESSLSGVDVRPSRLSGIRKIVDVVFSYTNRKTDVTDKYFVRVDVTGAFPFLVTKMSPYYDR
jgi:hypothetical protein